MPTPVTFTLDLEDLRSSPDLEVRVDTVAHRVFDRLAELGVTGSVFVVGDVLRDHPDLVRRVAADGHEIGLHALVHAPIGSRGPDGFRDDTAEGKARLEDLLGREVAGYRAPMMSLVPETGWATEILAELGFVYSSSVLPAPSPLYGWPGLPRTPFRWSSGLIELPCPVVRVAHVDVPFLGGAYLRLLPRAVLRYGLRRAPADAVLWSYCHPWEFDPDESFYVFDDGGWVASRVGWLNRKRMMARVERLLDHPRGSTLGSIAARLVDDPTLEVVDPTSFAPVAAAAPRRRLNGLLRTG
jgi:polysaccharide deacetylase family protein (PEP-CTERM system associated)